MGKKKKGCRLILGALLLMFVVGCQETTVAPTEWNGDGTSNFDREENQDNDRTEVK